MTKSLLVYISLVSCFSFLNSTHADVVSYTYDNLNRVTHTDIDEGEKVIEYSYDAAGNQVSATVIEAPGTDSDGDGEPDVTDPDDDNDGVSDTEESNLGLHPYLNDSDGDGLLDGFEVQYAFDPLIVGESGLDPDIDGLTNLQEQAVGTKPDKADTDDDGVNDGDEVANGTDPLVDESLNAPTKTIPTIPVITNAILAVLLITTVTLLGRRRKKIRSIRNLTDRY